MSTLSIFNPRLRTDLFDAMEQFFPSIHANDRETSLQVPKVDVRETKKEYILEMDLPGINENDVEISLKDRVLSIMSKKEDKKEEKEGEWLIRERNCSAFARHFTLPNDIESENISARFDHGILAINIQRKEQSEPKTIEIISNN